jgi:4-diphosphocytidyl-2-C-methyl-D-erythritol kinase
MSFVLPARAKINLSLDILGLLPGGYHRLETVMQSLAWHDRLLFSTKSEGVTFSCDSKHVPSGQDNLVCRAAALVQKESGLKRGAHIHLEKRIPVAAGLAGGSADAAATLLGLNRLWGLNWPEEKLLEMGARLGSDVPFCLVGGTVLARGRGELLTSVPPLPPMGVILVKPPINVSTADVYHNYDRRRVEQKQYTPNLIAAIKNNDFEGICRSLGNALEVVTISMHPIIDNLKKALLAAGAAGVLMSGSGPTVYGLAANFETARKIAGQLVPPAGTEVIATWTVKNLNSSN